MTDAARTALLTELIARRRDMVGRGPQRVDATDAAPLSSIQLSLWTMDALEARSGSINRPTAARFTGALEVDVLGRALQALVDRHEPLRTVYPIGLRHEPVQEVVEDYVPSLSIVDISELSRDARESAVSDALGDALRFEADPTREVQFDATLLVESAESHVLVVALSHITFDGWSEQLFYADLLELYRAELKSEEAQLPELPIRFSDYARWERRQLDDYEAADMEYWRETLTGVGPSPPLPHKTDRETAYDPVVARFSETEMSAIRVLARAENTTPFVVLLTGLELAARELTDAEDFLTLCPVAGRDQPETRDLISCFINHILIRSSFRDARTHRDHLRAVRERLADGLAHSRLSHRLVRALFTDRGQTPNLFTMSLQWRDFPDRTSAGEPPVALSVIHVPSPGAGLSLQITPDGDAALVEIHYNPRLFSHDFVSTWFEGMRRQIAGLAADPGSEIGPLRAAGSLPDREAGLSAPKIETVLVSIDRQVRLAPNAVAIRTATGELITYEELWDRSGRLAAALVDAGVQPGAAVGVLTNRNAGHVVAMVGVLRAGAVVVPLDAQLPIARLGLMAETAAVVEVVVVDQCGHLPQSTAEVHLDSVGRLEDLENEPLKAVGLDPIDDTAYIFFTSGTTADPKAVLGTHQALSHFLVWERSRLGILAADRIGGVTGASFDVSLREVFLPVTSGASLSLAPETIWPDRGLKWLVEAGVTVLHMTPSLASAWMADASGSFVENSLRWTLFAGESLMDHVVSEWRDAVGGHGRVMNLYGPTETCMVKSAYEVGSTPRPGVQPVGSPLPHSQLLVIDPSIGELCESGVSGEIYIRTAIGSLGYLGTSDGGFDPDLVPRQGDETVYRTGDLGWYESDWTVTIEGRIDDQIKIEGIRVEPGETAGFLLRHPNVRACAVFPVHQDGAARLQAFVVADGTPPSDKELRRHLHTWIRAAAIPPTFTVVEEIPLTSTNKVDRRALLEMMEVEMTDTVSNQSTDLTTTLSVSELREVVADIWANVLGTPDPDPDTDFFTAGGTSLRALRILARLEAATGMVAPLELFFDHPTFGAFCDALATGTERSPEPGLDNAAEGEVPAPLSFMQEAMWFESFLDPHAKSYDLDLRFEIQGVLDVEVLESAIAAVVKRHSVLRTTIRVEQGHPRIHILPIESLAMHLEDLRGGSSGAEAHVDARVDQYRRAMFDLEAGPLIRFVLFRLLDDSQQLYIRMHHTIVDGWSIRLLLNEIGEHYNARVEGRTPDVPLLEVQYGDYARRERERNESGAYDDDLDYWKELLVEPLPVFKLGAANRPTGNVGSSGHRFEFAPELAAELGETASDLRVTPFMLAVSLWAAFLCRKSDQAEVLIGVPMAARMWAPTRPLIGVFLNNLVVRLPGGETETLAELVTITRSQTIGAFNHAEVPFERVIEVAAPERRRSRVPVFQVLFQYHHEEADMHADLDLSGLTCGRVDNSASGPPLDLYLNLNHNSRGTVGQLHYDPRMFTDSEAEGLAREFLDFAREAVAEPSEPFPHIGSSENESDDGRSEGPRLSYGQERMWTIEQMEPGTSQYLMVHAQRVEGPVETGLLAQAMSTIVARHHIIRSRVLSVRGEPQLVVDPPWPVVISHHDLSQAASHARDEQLDTLIGGEFDKPFDLATDRLMRVMLIELGHEEAVLVTTFHHLVMDGQSFDVFAAELSEVYTALSQGTTAELPLLAYHYQNFVTEQRALIANDGYAAQMAYWDRVLELPLPEVSFAPRPTDGDPRVAAVARRPMRAELARQFHDTSSQLRVTPQMLCGALVAATACLETGAREVLLTSLRADRSSNASDALLGYFVNTIPLRVEVDRQVSFATLARRVRNAVLNGYQNGDVPLDLIFDQVRKAGHRGPIVGGLYFGYGAVNNSATELSPGISLTPISVAHSQPKFDLSISVVADGDAASVRINARSSVLSQRDADLLCEKFLAVAEACLASPQTAIGDVSRPTESASPGPLRQASRSEHELVSVRIAEWASGSPDRLAIHGVNRDWTTSDLDRLSAGVGAQLIAMGVQRGDRVLISARDQILGVAAMLGTWKVGATYVPIDVTQPRSRIEAVVADARPTVVVTDDETLQLGDLRRVVLHHALEAAATVTAVELQPEDPAYVIYTSGSTGRPKGVVISHRAVAAFAVGVAEAFGFTGSDRILLFHSLAFDASLEEIYLPLALGGTIVERPPDLLGSAAHLMRVVEAKQITHLGLPTSFWHELASQMVESGIHMPDCVRVVTIGGQAARPDVVREWLSHVPDVPLINSYGPTEATVSSVSAVLGVDDVGEHVSIGRPYSTVRAEVVDTADNPLGAGEWGELVLSGPQLATGYLGLDEATREVFVTRGDGELWYRTGDRARYRTNGEIELSGRLDSQVKIDGHRIELEEVEHNLVSLPGVSEAAVLAHVDSSESTVLHAFVVGADDLEPQNIRRALGDRVPAPMVPNTIHILDEFVRGVGAKIDRGVLRGLISADPVAVVEPAAAVESVVDGSGAVLAGLVEIWRGLLEVDASIELGPGSDFFELGGRSLTAVRLAYLIEDRFGVSLPVVAIFESPTIGQLAQLLRGEAALEPVAVESAVVESVAVVEPVVVEYVVDGSGAVLAGLVEIWRGLLEVDASIELGPGSDFFELGGRSLTAVRLAYLIEDRFGVSLPVVAIFESPTIGQLAQLLGGEAAVEPPPSRPAPPAVREDPAPVTAPASAPSVASSPRPAAILQRPAAAASLSSAKQPMRLHLERAPLSLAQQRMWLHSELLPDTMHYLLPVGFRLRGQLDSDALAAALLMVVERHEALRTRFVSGPDGIPMQIIDPQQSGPFAGSTILERVDLTQIDPAQRRDRAHAAAAQFVNLTFDTATEHPFRAQLCQISATDHHFSLLFHHLACDDRSVGLVLGELSGAYAAVVEGHAWEHGPAPLQFADYATWQRAQLLDGRYEESLDYWRRVLGESPRAIEVPGRRLNARPGGTVHDHKVDLSPSVGRALLGLAKQHGVSPFQLLIALVSALFHRIDGSTQIVMGAPGSERRTEILESVVGLFVNTLVLPTEVHPTSTFSDMLSEIRSTVAHAVDHGDVPFDVLINDLQIDRDVSRLPLISVMCSFFEPRRSAQFRLGDLDVQRERSGGNSTGTIADLMVTAASTETGLSIRLSHDDGVVEYWAVAQLARGLEQLANAVSIAPDDAISSIPLIDGGEERWLAVELNQNARPFPDRTRVDVTFSEIASERKSAVAVSDGRRELTYSQLDTEAVLFAEHLAKLGVEPGDTVAVEMERSIALVIALVGILRAGAVYVPIDVAAPAARRDAALVAAGARVIATRNEADDLRLETFDTSRVDLPEHGADVPAYVMFTSGSTGTPKGTVISHRAIQRLVHKVDYADLSPSAVIAMASNPAFDALTFEVWGALLNGARIEILDADTISNPARLESELTQRRINTAFMTTALVNVIVATAPSAFTCLETLMVGGEALDVATTRSLVEAGPRRLINIYGPTECTTFSAWHLIRDIPADATSIPIGGPTRNTALYVLDQSGQLAPNGITGELGIGGPGLAMGYLGDEDLTADRFIRLDIAGDSIRIYRTGDVVRRRKNGEIEFIGRRDRQIKLRGLRIELSEIEAALVGDPTVGSAAVEATGDGSRRRIVGFVTPARPGADLEASSVRSNLASHVPNYMVPSQIVVIEAMPMTQAGKVDRAALAIPVVAEAVESNRGLDHFEQAVLEFWTQTLHLVDVDPDQDFFDAGGNSLLAVELLTKLESRFGVHLRLSTLFEARTPRQLAAVLRSESSVTVDKAAKYLVRLREGSPAHPTPLWLVHPAGGSLILYEPMVSHLVTPRRILGVEAAGLDGGEPALADMNALADHQLSVLLREQPSGPYRIAGFSIGGILAMEVARRLHARGEVVEFLGAIEAGVPALQRQSESRLRKYGRMARGGDIAGIGRSVVESVRGRKQEMGAAVTRRRTLEGAHQRVLKGMVDAFMAFEPEPLDVALTLFFGDESSEGSLEGLIGRWRALATGGVEIVRVTGGHDGDMVLREPHAKVLAMALEDALAACDRRRES